MTTGTIQATIEWTRISQREAYRKHGGFGSSGKLPELGIRRIAAVLGQPDRIDPDAGDGKVTRSWTVEFADGIVGSIWDYKGARWSLGGHAEGVRRIERMLDCPRID